MKAVWNAKVGYSMMMLACFSCGVTALMLAIIFFPIPLSFQFSSYLEGRPFWISVLISLVLLSISSFAKRDHGVSITVVPEGLFVCDARVGYERQDFIENKDLREVLVRRNPFFSSLIIELKEKNQRFLLCNMEFSDEFILLIRARINKRSSTS